MIYGSIKNVAKPVSRIIFGCGATPMLQGQDVSRSLDAAIEQGINTFDTAENYGRSEEALGRWLKARKNRDEVVIITKGCHPYGHDRVTPECMRHDIEQSFERLGTDYIDIYLLHRDDTRLRVGPMVEILNEYHRAGRIGAFGGSNWTHERIAEANAYARERGLTPFTVSSPGYSLARTARNPWEGEGVSISGPENRDARAWYVENRMPVIAFSSLGRGLFSGKVKPGDEASIAAAMDEPAVKGFLCDDNLERLRRAEQLAVEKGTAAPQIALAFLLAQAVEAYPVVSSMTPSHIAANASAVDVRLTPAQCRWLDLEE